MKIIKNQNEIWKDIPGYEGLYQASNFGMIKSLSGKKRGTSLTKEIILKSMEHNSGYFMIFLYKDKKREHIAVHRLILKAFFGECELECNHKNGIKQDNRLDNLEYCTRSENIKHAYDIGLKKKGENHRMAKLNDSDIILIRKLWNEYRIKQTTIACLFNTPRKSIHAIVNNKRRV